MRRKIASKKAKPDTRKIVGRITYNPKKHKERKTRELRQQLQKKQLQRVVEREPSASLKFGSLNINGLDIEASWAVEQLLRSKDFDVSIIFLHQFIHILIVYNHRFLH